MLEYDKIDINEGIDVNKNKLVGKECIICNYWYFININFNYQRYVCDGCHDMSLKTSSMHNLAIGYNNGNAYRINFGFMSKSNALNLIKNAVIIDKKGYYKAKNNNFLSVHSIKTSSQKTKFGNKEVDKKEFYLSKQAILLDSVDLSKIVVSSKWKINDTTYQYFCRYLNDNVIQPFCVILPQMSGYIKYFNDGGKNMSFVTDDEEVYEKYNEIWNVVLKLLKLKFTVSPVRDDKYIISKLKIFNGINRRTFTDNVIPIEKIHYICIPAIDIDSVLKIEKKAYPQAYLEQCKYKLKKRNLVNFMKVMIVVMIIMKIKLKLKVKMKIFQCLKNYKIINYEKL